MSEKQEKAKKINIDIIDTPRGAVPTAEAFKNVIEAWNETIELINENLGKIAFALTAMEDAIAKLNTSVGNLIRKVDVLTNFLTDVKVSIEHSNRLVEREMEILKKIISDGSVNMPQKTSYGLLRDMLLGEASDETIGSTKKAKLMEECLDPIESEGKKISKSNLNKILKEKIMIIQREPAYVLALAKTLAKLNGFEAFYLDLKNLKSACMGKVDLIIDQIVSSERRLVVVFLSSQKIIGLPSFLDDISNSVRTIEKLKNVIEEKKLQDKVLIFQVDNIEEIDPLILQKIKKLGV